MTNFSADKEITIDLPDGSTTVMDNQANPSQSSGLVEYIHQRVNDEMDELEIRVSQLLTYVSEYRNDNNFQYTDDNLIAIGKVAICDLDELVKITID